MASEHGKTEAGFRLWTQAAKEEWVTNLNGDWRWGHEPLIAHSLLNCATVTAAASAPPHRRPIRRHNIKVNNLVVRIRFQCKIAPMNGPFSEEVEIKSRGC